MPTQGIVPAAIARYARNNGTSQPFVFMPRAVGVGNLLIQKEAYLRGYQEYTERVEFYEDTAEKIVEESENADSALLTRLTRIANLWLGDSPWTTNFDPYPGYRNALKDRYLKHFFGGGDNA